MKVLQAGSAVADRTKTDYWRCGHRTHYITFVADDNSSATAETVYTDGGIQYNPAMNLLTVAGRIHALNLTLDSVSNLLSLGAADISTLKVGGVAVTSTAC